MTRSEPFDFTGRCLCGSVGFSGRFHPTDALTACHCGQCRIWSGHYWASISAVGLVVEREGDLKWYRSSETAMRGFCGTCGSSLFWREDHEPEGRIAVSAAVVEVAAGALDRAAPLKLARHIFVADKGDYYDITDGLPQFPQG